MTSTIPSLANAFSALVKPITSAFSTPAIPSLSAPRPGVSSPTALSSASTPAIPNLGPTSYSSLKSPEKSYSILTPPSTKYSTLSNPTPNTPAVPNIATYTPAPNVVTPSGTTVNPNTGGVVKAPAVPSVAPAPSPVQSAAAPAAAPVQVGDNTGNQAASFNYSGSAGGAPTIPSVGTGAGSPKSAYEMYQESLKMTPEEEAAQKRLDDLNTSAEMAYRNTENQAIPLEFITGQKAALQRSAETLTKPLTAQLALLQAKRQIATTASKAALDREDKKLEGTSPVTVSAGASLVDPKTGKVLYTAPSAKTASTGGGAFSGGGTQISPTAKNIIDLINKGADMDSLIKGTSEDAQALRNEVYAGLAEQGGRPAVAVELFKEGKEIVDDLLNTSAYEALGGWSTRLGGQFGTEYGDAMAKAQQLSAILAKDNLGLLKGAMSDKDMEFIKAMSTGFEGAGIQSEKYMKERLEAIQTKLAGKIAESGAGGETAPAEMQLPNGTIVKRQADGTYK